MNIPLKYPFRVREIMIITRGDGTCPFQIQATVKIEAGGRVIMAAAESNSESSALEKAMRQALDCLYDRTLGRVDIPLDQRENSKAVFDFLKTAFVNQLVGGEYE